MFGSQYHPQQSGGGLIGVFQTLATPIALVATIFIGPLVWPAIEAPVTQSLVSLYGWQVAQWLGWAVWALIWPTTFSLIRAALMGALLALSAFASNRLI